MSRVKRAIIMAAGKGARLNPVTLDTPKSLVKVNGIRIIDSVIQGLHNNGIKEIYIVAGYLKEQFYELLNEYEGIHILENPRYETWNNIFSLYVARDYIEDSIILDGDQFIYNDSILSPEFEKSGYNAVWTDSKTDEWLMQVENEKVVSCSRAGGAKGWQLYSISRWNASDAKKLKAHLELEVEENKRKDIYWDDVVMFCHFDDYDLGIRPMGKNDVIEIDTINELAMIDKTYSKYVEEL